MDNIILIDNGKEIRSLESFGLFAYPEHTNPSSADFLFNTEKIQSNIWLFGSIRDTKVATIPCFFEGNQMQFQIILNQLNEFFFDEFMKPIMLKISFDYETDRYMHMYLSEPFDLSRNYDNKEISLSFIAFDSKKYSKDKASDITWGSTTINFKSNYKLGNTGSGANGITITSNTTLDTFVDGKAVKPSVKLVGTGTNVKIACAGRVIDVGTFTGKTIIIDTEQFIAYFNGVETLIDMDDFYIVPSSKVSITGTNMNFTLTIDYQNVYM